MRGKTQHGENEFCTRALFGEALRTWRKKKGIPLKAVAADVCVSIETVSAWETGIRFPTPENLDKLSQYTGMPVCRFFCRNQLKSCLAECRSDRIIQV